MNPAALGWQNVYVIVGCSAATLIGMQFVVMALIANVRMRADLDSVNTFGSPTVAHLSAALVVSCVMVSPWPSLTGPAVMLLLCGVSGLGYALIVVRRALRQHSYEPVAEDWFWYAIFPCAIYGLMTAGAIGLCRSRSNALFAIAGATLCLLIVAVHNAWDSVTHIVLTSRKQELEQTK